MATMSTLTQLTLVEVAKRKDPDGNMATIAEVLAENNDIVSDAIFREANDTFSHKTTRRSYEPTGSWRKINEGIASETSKTTEIIDTIGFLESRAENDVRLIQAFADMVQGRNDEAMGFVGGMGKTMAAAMIYGNSATTPEKFTGVAPRLNSLATDDNVLNEGGTTANVQTSIYVINWGINNVHMIYPRNSVVGLQHEDLGIETVESSSGLKFRAYVDWFTWDAGMVVRNNKNIGRLANIEQYTVGSNMFDNENLIRLLNRMETGPNTMIYCNESVKTQMEILVMNKNNAYYTLRDEPLAPGPVLRFKGFPVREVAQILNTEAVLT